MSQVYQGDVQVKRTLNVDRRVNQGLSKETLVAARTVTINDFAWLQIINASTQDVVLPDATSLTEGWDIIVMADTSSGASVNVKTYHAVTPVLLKNILAGRAYRFSLINNGTAAGTWHKDYLEEADLIPAGRYVDSFNGTSDWSGPTLGYYTRTVTAATHIMGTSPNVSVFLGPAPFVGIQPDQISVASNGDITLQVPSVPDLRFAGKAIIS